MQVKETFFLVSAKRKACSLIYSFLEEKIYPVDDTEVWDLYKIYIPIVVEIDRSEKNHEYNTLQFIINMEKILWYFFKWKINKKAFESTYIPDCKSKNQRERDVKKCGIEI